LKFKKKIENIFNTWVGLLIYIIVGILIVQLIFGSWFGSRIFILYIGIILINVLIFYFTDDRDSIGYIYLGIGAAYFLNYGLGLFFGTDLPVVAVVSDSMTHDPLTPVNHYQFLENTFGYTKQEIDSWSLKNGFLKGDVLVVFGVKKDDLKIGDVIVYDINGQSTPIVHRIVKFEDDQIITKGDHNPSFDPWRLTKIHGKAVFVIPYLGWPKLLLTGIWGAIAR
jgi:signal peptidase